mmetsp:Transcript_8455/g.11406  ORF Transcript_8455/g.11406 Transcript_8455/m.11406 type:complete len:146 (-) Transcript_8455:122-559(-)
MNAGLSFFVLLLSFSSLLFADDLSGCYINGDVNTQMLLALGKVSSQTNLGCFCVNSLPDFVSQGQYQLKYYIGFYDSSTQDEKLNCTVYDNGSVVKGPQTCTAGSNLGYGPVSTSATHCITVTAPNWESTSAIVVPVFASVSPLT